MAKVCVIGAGCSGITTIKNLIQAGIKEVVCFEQNHDVGGNWLYSPKLSHSSVCETTHIISSKKLSEFVDFPMPEDYPDYPSHSQVLAYFKAYCKEFGLYPYIKFNTKVAQVNKMAAEKWEVRLEDGNLHVFDYVFVANGHHSVPRHPDFKDDFEGEYLHAHQYKINQPFKNKKVLVVGAGNSGCDCAVEISRVADKVGISMRSPQYIVPKFLFGKPTDSYNEKMLWVPNSIKKVLQKISLKLQIGSYEDYGLPTPDYPVTMAHPTINSELLYKIRHGKVHPRKGIEKIDGHTIHFTDGVAEEYDTLLAATGYKIALPFFEKDFICYEEADRIPLYLRMFHADHPTLIFVGLFQPQGAIWPVCDLQAKLAANYVAGRWQLPNNIKELAEQDADHIEKEFIKSKRHTIEVHFHEFRRHVLKQIPKDAPDWNAPLGDKSSNVQFGDSRNMTTGTSTQKEAELG